MEWQIRNIRILISLRKFYGGKYWHSFLSKLGLWDFDAWKTPKGIAVTGLFVADFRIENIK